ncbi:MAG: Holliday junction branch migration protein RuvA [Fusobacterium sp.]|uniref:Holliday junction branch migration protein RuvA n=1 Tax=Fusobacterium sp. TaxID=68766 RepID=UPI0026DB366A|nr:Holliday junction branch migration protein RuvA [Fusobacterium sp.]MDO4690524.1 Holliday junction branch migration protein RuvA [Fusobacterium sp.]
MFEYLYGTVSYKKLEYIALDLNGVGYKIYISLREYEKLMAGEKYKLFIFNYIREDANKLIGFLEEKERKLFEMLLNVKGIGLSLALAILSTFSYNRVVELIISEDVENLKKVPKLGEKKAQLIILDLKKKLKNIDVIRETKISSYLLDDLILALEALGYAKKDIDKILQKTDLDKFSSIEDAIKEVLKKIKVEA